MPPVATEVTSPFLLVALVACAAVAAWIATRLRLPAITGALVAGFVMGPVLHLVKPSGTSVTVLAALALSVIALLAGARLTPDIMRATARSAVTSTVVQLVVCVPLITLAFWSTAPIELVPFALLCGVVVTTRSPIITVAILRETKADGPLARHVLSVVVLQSAATLPLFFAALTHARTSLGGEALHASDIAKACASLVLVIAGFVIANAHARGRRVLEIGGRGAPVLLIAFFAFAGASVDAHALYTWWPLALALSAARAALTFVACRIAHAIAGDVDIVKRWAWIGLVPQAGVTAALASLVAIALRHDHGPAFATVVMTIVFVDEIVGAPLLRVALVRAGEAKA